MAARLDQSIKDEIVKLHDRGMEPADIARQLGVKDATVHHALKDHELAMMRGRMGDLLTPAELAALEINELTYLYPEYTEEQLDHLADSIAKSGLDVPLVVWRRKWIIDGRHRFMACRNRGIKLKPTDFVCFEGTEEEAREKVDRLNLERRHLDRQEEERLRSKRAMRAVQGARGEDGRLSRDAREAAAKEAGVGRTTVAYADQVARKSPGVAAEVAEGRKTIGQARAELGLDPRKVTRAEPERRTTLEQVQEEYDERAAMRDADSDECWVEGLDLYKKLSGKQRDAFARAATNWRRTTAMRESWKAILLLGVRGNQKADPYTRRHIRALTCGDPADWDLCSAEDDGGCDGTGRVPDLGDGTRSCRECDGDGFKVR